MENTVEKITMEGDEPSANGWFQVDVPNDGLVAKVKKIVRHSGDGKPVTTNDILNKLKQLKVTHGINKDAIEKLVRDVEDNKTPEEPVIIAKGDVENGENGSIEWCIDGIKEKGAKILVAPNIKIAVKTLASQGKKGKDVFGKPKNPRPGFDQQIVDGEGVTYKQESDGVVIYETTHAGLLQFESGTLSVDSGITVSEDRLKVEMNIPMGNVYGLERGLNGGDILSTLSTMGVQYGIQPENIQAALTEAPSSNETRLSVCVAKGKAAIDGQDDKVEWLIDYEHEDLYKHAVLPGQTIVKIHSKAAATPGVDVYGETLEGNNGNIVSFNCGAGVEQVQNKQISEYKARWLGVVQFDTEKESLCVKSGIKISKDNMQATMSLLRPDIATDEGNIQLVHVLMTLKEHDVVYGIKEDAIKLVLENINKSKSSKLDLLVAKGLPAKDGHKAKVEFTRELNSSGKILPDGSVDYHDKSYPWNVKVNDVIGTWIPPVLAIDGRNIKGEVIEADQCDNAEPDFEGIQKEADGKLRVTEDGILIINDNHYKVSDSLELEGDVCQRTGNIQADKTVNVKGYVEPGFLLETKGDAIIQENVEDSTVQAEGSVVIKSGIRGTQSKIEAGCNITATFAENAELNAGGDIHIQNNIINCHSVCKGVIQVGDTKSAKSSLSGNITHAYRGVKSSVIGSDSFNKTIVIAGAGIEDMKLLMDEEEELKKVQATLDDLKKVYEHLCKKPQPQDQQNETLLKLEETREAKSKEYEALKKDYEELKALVDQSKEAKIQVYRRIYPGVKLLIANKVYEVKEERGAGIFQIKGEKIIFEPT